MPPSPWLQERGCKGLSSCTPDTCVHTYLHTHWLSRRCLGGEAFSLRPPTGPWLEAAELVPRPLLQSARHLSATAGARAGGEWTGASLLGGQLAGTLTCNWAAWDGWSSLMRRPVRLRGLKGLNALWTGLALAENCFLVPGRPLLPSDQEPGPDLPAPQCEGPLCVQTVQGLARRGAGSCIRALHRQQGAALAPWGPGPLGRAAAVPQLPLPRTLACVAVLGAAAQHFPAGSRVSPWRGQAQPAPWAPALGPIPGKGWGCVSG